MAIRVLLAEDDPGQRRVMEYLLTEEGYTVSPVASGRKRCSSSARRRRTSS